MKGSCATLLIILFISNWSQGQITIIDSLRQLSHAEINDSLKIRAISDIGYEYEKMGVRDSAIYYYQKAISSSIQNNQDFLEAQNYRYLGLFYSTFSQLDSALKYYLKAEDIFKSTWDGGELGKLLLEIGNLHYVRSNFIPGIKYYQESAEYYEERENHFGQAISYGNLGALYFEQDQWEKSEFYHQKSYDLALLADNTKSMATALHNIGGIWEKRDSLDKARALYEQALDKYGSEADDHFRSHAFNSLASIHAKQQNFEKAIDLGIKAIEFANTPALKAAFQIHLGHYYKEAGIFDKAEKQLLEGIKVSSDLGLQWDLNEGLLYVYKLYAKQGKFEKAYSYADWHNAVSDSIFDQEIQDRIHHLETQFRTEQQAKENMALKVENAEKALSLKVAQSRLKFRNFITLFSVVLLSAAGITFYFYRQNAFKEKQLIISQAMIAGEETERNRLARELHDGLGGLLSTANLQLGHLGKAQNLQSNSDFSKASHLIQKASKELRHVAHNLMPVTLLRMGLIPALEDLCSDLSFGQSLEVDLQHYGVNGRLPNRYELGIYRIVQELLNNIVKHANASQAWIQIIKRNDQISITVEDNGQGFDMFQSSSQEGMGLKNIRTRVGYLNGTIDWFSDKSDGTSVHLELRLDT